jgi:hypothetical protein
MKKQANKFRSERQFAVGDLVYLKLQPYIQLSVSRRAHQKLAFKFFEPYSILECVGKVALSPGASFYCLSASCVPRFLVEAICRDQPVSSTLPTDLVEFQVPLRVL